MGEYEKLKRKVAEFRDARDWEQFHSPKNLVMALGVEVAEIAEHFQWLTEDQSRSLPSEKLARVRDELGDAMIYLVMLSDKLGADPLAAALDKIAVNESKYPADAVRGDARKYTEYKK